MKVLAYLLYSFTFASLQLVNCLSVCPLEADIAPCKCYHGSQQIVCTGTEFNDVKLVALGSKLTTPWKYLYIHGTEITNIPANTFITDFERIFIVSNGKLAKIDPSAFKKSSVTSSLVIRDNHALSDPHLFNVVKALGKSLTIVELDKNAIADIPDKAFDDLATGDGERAFKLLEIIRLDDQQPTKTKLNTIGASSFASLPKLKQLSLDKNKIGSIGAAGIDLTSSDLNTGDHISLFLEDSELTEALITAEKIKIPVKQGVSVGLVLSKNKIATLAKPFIDLVSSIALKDGGKVYLNDQASLPTCDCINVKSIIDIFKATAVPTLKGSIQGLADACKLAGADKKIGECPAN